MSPSLIISLVTAAVVIVVVSVMLAIRAASKRRRVSTLDARRGGEPANPPTGAAGVSRHPAGRDRPDDPRSRAARENMTRRVQPGATPDGSAPDVAVGGVWFGGWNSGASGPVAESSGGDGASTHGAHTSSGYTPDTPPHVSHTHSDPGTGSTSSGDWGGYSGGSDGTA
jgi:hypothetical protein